VIGKGKKSIVTLPENQGIYLSAMEKKHKAEVAAQEKQHH
jgi:hypothetical protein